MVVVKNIYIICVHGPIGETIDVKIEIKISSQSLMGLNFQLDHNVLQP